MLDVWILVRIELPIDKFPFKTKCVNYVPRRLIQGNGGNYGLTNRIFFKKYFDDILYRVELTPSNWVLSLYLKLKNNYCLNQVELGIRFRLRKILFGSINIVEIKNEFLFHNYPKYFRRVNKKRTLNKS